MSGPTKKYKLWESDPSAHVPLRTLSRWALQAANTETALDENPSESPGCSNLNDTTSNIVLEIEHEESVSDRDHGTDCAGVGHGLEVEDNENEITVVHDRSAAQTDSDKLYQNCMKSTDECVLDVLELYIKHKITKDCLANMLRTTISMLPESNNMPKTVHMLFAYPNKQLPNTSTEIEHYYCKSCKFYLGTQKPSVCQVCSSKAAGIFYEIDPLEQIKHMFECRNLANIIESRHMHSFDRNLLYDLTDGTEYVRVNSNRGLYDLTLILSTDGVSLKKSSKADLWLLMFMIAEVPDHLRESFMVITSVWYDTCKPVMNTFLQPFCCKLKNCYDNGGMEWIHPTTKVTCKSNIVAPLFIADAPARAMVQNVQQFNGRFACNLCEQKTSRSTVVEGRKCVRVFKFQNISARLRTGQRMHFQAKKAAEDEKVDAQVKGVKGYSVVSILPGIDLGTCVIPEFMHSVLLGVTRQLLTLWFQKPGDWNMKGSMEAVDSVLLNIRPPNTFSRLPRSLSLSVYWKAYEYLLWLLFYSVPALEGHMTQANGKYFQHFLLLVISIFSLLKKPVEIVPDLEDAESFLRLFVRDVENLYGDRELTYNVHQLLHLCVSVRRWGPLWSNSAFPFENMNGTVGKFVHGSKHIGKEIIKNLRTVQGVHALRNKVFGQHKVSELMPPNQFIMKPEGKMRKQKLSQSESDFILSKGFDPDMIDIYARASIGGEIFTSELYKEVKTNSYTVCLKQRTSSCVMYASIKLYFQTRDGDFYIILNPYNVDHSKIIFHQETMKKVKHIVPVSQGAECLLMKPKDLLLFQKVVKVGRYLCKRPNVLQKVF